MIRAVQLYFSSIPAVFIDGLLYVLLAFFSFWTGSFSSDDAGKYISPIALWWGKQVLGSVAAGLLAVKMYRSTSFADHQQQKKNDTAFLSRPNP